MHFLIFSNLSGCTVQNIQRTKKRKFNHSVKLAVSWDNYPWEVSVTFPPLCPLGYGKNSVGQQRLLVDVSSEGFSSRRDSEMLWLVAVSSLAHLLFIHWKSLCPDFLFWGREQGLAKTGPSMWALGSQRGADAATVVRNLHSGSLERGTSSCLPHCWPQSNAMLWLPKSWPARFLIPEPQLIYLLSIWTIQAPLCRQGS